MRVLFINGSPHPKGCSWRAMVEISKVLHDEGIEENLPNEKKALLKRAEQINGV